MVYNFYSNATPSQHLLVKRQKWKHQTKVWKLFKVSNEDTRTTLLTSFLSYVFIVKFELSDILLVFPLLIFNKEILVG